MNQLPIDAKSMNVYTERDGPDGCLFQDNLVVPPTTPPTTPPTMPPTMPPPAPLKMNREITEGLLPYKLGIEYNVGDDLSPEPSITKLMRQQTIGVNELPWTNSEDSDDSMPELCDGDVPPPPPPPQMVRQNTLCIPRDNLSDAVEEMRVILETPRMERQSTDIPNGPKSIHLPYVGDPMSRSPMTMRMFDDDGTPLTTQLLHERLGNLKKSLNECAENIRLVEKHYT
jgi:hypothetical protein